ncbi:MAG: hypothetical protein QOH82_1366, partial [Mycobacterium sp.]|nr:hypothetical protein [Mycobacterium sp.]
FVSASGGAIVWSGTPTSAATPAPTARVSAAPVEQTRVDPAVAAAQGVVVPPVVVGV